MKKKKGKKCFIVLYSCYISIGIIYVPPVVVLAKDKDNKIPQFESCKLHSNGNIK